MKHEGRDFSLSTDGGLLSDSVLPSLSSLDGLKDNIINCVAIGASRILSLSDSVFSLHPSPKGLKDNILYYVPVGAISSTAGD